MHSHSLLVCGAKGLFPTTSMTTALCFPERPFHAGPPPPSPPASVHNDHDDHHDGNRILSPHPPRLTMPSQSESAVRAQTLPQASSSNPQLQPSLVSMSLPEPASRQDGHFHHHTAMVVNTKTSSIGQPAAASGGVVMPVPVATPLQTQPPRLTSSPKQQRHYQSFAPPQSSHQHNMHHPQVPQTPVHLHPHRSHYAQDDTAVLNDATQDLQSDIDIQTEQVRRERQSKRAKAQAEAEAVAALTRTDTRGTKGTKGDEQDDSKPHVGNVIGEDHVNYVLMYNMLTGIRIGVSRCQAKIKKALTNEDFTAKHKYSFDMYVPSISPVLTSRTNASLVSGTNSLRLQNTISNSRITHLGFSVLSAKTSFD